MQRVFINEDNLKKEDLDYEVIRVKGLIVNSKNQILLARNNNTYQFVGGHVEDNEDMEEGLIREIKEETGIDVIDVNGPFMLVEAYYKDYFCSSKNVHSKVYYYRIFCDDMPNLEETNYDILERQTDFEIFYIPIKRFKAFLEDGLENGLIDASIYTEMMFAIEEYNRLFGGVYY